MLLEGQALKAEQLGRYPEVLIVLQGNGVKQSARKNPDVKAPPPNIYDFLFEVGIMEIRYIRMLANLCSLTYSMTKMSVSFTNK